MIQKWDEIPDVIKKIDRLEEDADLRKQEAAEFTKQVERFVKENAHEMDVDPQEPNVFTKNLDGVSLFFSKLQQKYSWNRKVCKTKTDAAEEVYQTSAADLVCIKKTLDDEKIMILLKEGKLPEDIQHIGFRLVSTRVVSWIENSVLSRGDFESSEDDRPF
jgi:hypothetical protein